MEPIARPRLEIHRDGGSRLRCEDAAAALARWREEEAGAVQMAYMDPPFMSGGTYLQTQRIGEQGWRGHRDFIRTVKSFSDRWPGGPPAYLAMMEDVLVAARELLTGDGCLFVHADWRAAADLRFLLDRIFGRDPFRQ